MQEHIEGNFEIRKTFVIALLSLTTVRITSGQENWGGRRDAARPTADAFGVYLIQLLYKTNEKRIRKLIHNSIANKTLKI